MRHAGLLAASRDAIEKLQRAVGIEAVRVEEQAISAAQCLASAQLECIAKLVELFDPVALIKIQEYEQFDELKNELRKYWDSFKPQQPQTGQANNQRQTGKIDRILHNDEKGTDGFIKYNGNKSVYFRVNPDDEIKSKINLGLTVEFKIIPATNDKKERAIHLKAK